MRVFHIPVDGSCADPAWLIACVEVIGSEYIRYSTYEPIQILIAECERKQTEAVGAAKEFDRIMKMFGARDYPELQAMADGCKKEVGNVASDCSQQG